MLRIWWHRRYTNIDAHTSFIPVDSLQKAIFALHILTEDEKDDNYISLNTGGLEIYSSEDNDWSEWYSQSDEDIFEYGKRLEEESNHA